MAETTVQSEDTSVISDGNISVKSTGDIQIANVKLEKVFSSIASQLSNQTKHLKNISGHFDGQSASLKEMAEDAKRAREQESVSKADTLSENGSDSPTTGSSQNESDGGGSANLVGGLSGIIGGALAGLSASIGPALLRGGLALAIAPLVSNFLEGAISEGLTQLEIEGDAADKAAEAGGIALTAAWIGKTIFGRFGGVAGFFGALGYAYGDELFKFFGGTDDKNVLGVEEGTFSMMFAALSAAVGVVVTKMGLAAIKAMGVKVGLTTTAKVGATAAGQTLTAVQRAALAGKMDVKPPTIKPSVAGIGNALKTGTGVLPTGVTLNSAGRPINTATGQFKSVREVAEAMEKDATKAAKFAKYAKFFKFAGPAAAVLPALIDPAIAIYNDESDEEIRKQIVGALGSVSGAYLGGALGLAGTTMIPLLGQSGIGNFLGTVFGAVGGAFAGEFLAEEVADMLMGGSTAEPLSAEEMRHQQAGDKRPIAKPRPTESGVIGDYGRNDWDNLYEGKLNPTTGMALPGFDPLTLAPDLVPKIKDTTKLDQNSSSSNNSGSGDQPIIAQTIGGNDQRTTTIGGASTTYHVHHANGSNALSNHIPIPMTA